jgi:toxin ParE1/3/4
MAHRVSPQAEDDLDAIWLYVARESSSVEVATRLIETITARFALLAVSPYLGRSRSGEFGHGVRSFPVGEYLILYIVEAEEVYVLRVVHGKRDLWELF